MNEFDREHNDIFWYQMRNYWKTLFYYLASINCDFFDFLPKFFHSNFVHNCDIRNPYYTSMFWYPLLLHLKEKEGITVETTDHQILNLILSRWVADFYVSAMHYLKMDGSEVYDKIPLETLLDIYPGIHDKPIQIILQEMHERGTL